MVIQEAEFNQRFKPLSWAKNGRWLMMLYSEHIEGAATAIFDVSTQKNHDSTALILLCGAIFSSTELDGG